MATESVDEEQTILLNGPITLYEVARIRASLRAALDQGMPLRIDLRDSGPWDLAGLQLLISCARAGGNLNQVVRLRNTPEACVEVAERSGLAEWLRSLTE
jgi:ABC-type transporter Mla MlaB component